MVTINIGNPDAAKEKWRVSLCKTVTTFLQR